LHTQIPLTSTGFKPEPSAPAIESLEEVLGVLRSRVVRPAKTDDTPLHLAEVTARARAHPLFSNIDSKQAGVLLAGKPTGEVLLRPGKAGNITMSFVNRQGQVGHTIVQLLPTGFQPTGTAEVFRTVDELVAALQATVRGGDVDQAQHAASVRSHVLYREIDSNQAVALLQGKPPGPLFCLEIGWLSTVFLLPSSLTPQPSWWCAPPRRPAALPSHL
jgi:hypothetical protein